MIEKPSDSEVRSLAVAASGLGVACNSGLEGSLEALRRLGSVQIDTISVVERAHHHILWTRNPEYRLDHILKLEAEPRRAIEYWSHAAAYLPIEEYRFCLPRMARIRDQGHEWFRADPEAITRVRERIREDGPARAQDLGGATKGATGWWDWKPEKRALEYLFHAGELVSITRRGFQKVYDLAERVLPRALDRRMPSAEEMASHYVASAVSSLGVFAEADIAYLRKDGVAGISAELATRVAEGRLVELEVAGRRHFAAPALLEAPHRGSGIPRLLVLSPFDPLIIDRKRTARLFRREYQLECYLPSSKRKFGYFALPLLLMGANGDASLVGLLDAKAERGRGTLVARRMVLDPPSVERSRVAFASAAAEALRDFARFNGMDGVEIERFESADGRLERSLRAAVARR
jgi:uncharacterized protein